MEKVEKILEVLEEIFGEVQDEFDSDEEDDLIKIQEMVDKVQDQMNFHD